MTIQRRGISEQRRMDVKRQDDSTPKVTRVSGRVLIQGVGQILTDVNFPVWFSERPIVSFGCELDENFQPVTGSFPTADVCVVNWTKENSSQGFEGYFRGCQLALTVTGSADQQLWVHWTMEAKALRGPTTGPSGEGLDGTI
jgi:hypothetical protein